MPHASAITRIVQQLGGAFGIAFVAVVLTTTTTQAGHPEAGLDAAFWWAIAFSLAAAVAALLLPAREPGRATALAARVPA
jgi:hypothetical protein